MAAEERRRWAVVLGGAAWHPVGVSSERADMTRSVLSIACGMHEGRP